MRLQKMEDTINQQHDSIETSMGNNELESANMERQKSQTICLVLVHKYQVPEATYKEAKQTITIKRIIHNLGY